MSAIMDRFIKIVPVIVAVCVVVIIWDTDDAEYTNTVASSLCASFVLMLASIVYIILDHFKQRLMPAGHYVVVMFVAAFITFAVLYASLEYFYT